MKFIILFALCALFIATTVSQEQSIINQNLSLQEENDVNLTQTGSSFFGDGNAFRRQLQMRHFRTSRPAKRFECKRLCNKTYFYNLKICRFIYKCDKKERRACMNKARGRNRFCKSCC